MRGALFVIAAVIATAGVIVGYQQLRPSEGGQAASQGSAPQSSDPTEELAGRLLLPGYYGSQDNAKYEIHLFPAQLPPDPKIDLPQPAGARLVGSALRTRNGAAMSLDAVFDVPAATSDVPAFYERELAKSGWAPAPNKGQQMQGGFIPAVVTANRMFCKGENPPWLSITVFSPPSAPVDVRAHVDFMNPAIPSGGMYVGPCSSQIQMPQPGGMNKLPALRAPTGVLLRGGMGGIGGNDRQSSESGATTTMSASDLEAAFAQQLVAAGWTRMARSSDGPIAWSTWKLPGDADWRGLLLVNELNADRRSLLLRAELN